MSKVNISESYYHIILMEWSNILFEDIVYLHNVKYPRRNFSVSFSVPNLHYSRCQSHKYLYYLVFPYNNYVKLVTLSYSVLIIY